MAKKSSLKKQKTDKFILKVFIGFAVIIVGLTVAIQLFESSKKVYAYEDFEDIRLGNYAEMTTQAEDTYVVYYYSEYCGFCTEIKDIVLEFAEGNDEDVKMYLIDSYNVEGTNPEPEGSQYRYTPAMFVVKDGEVVTKYSGAEDIPAALKEIEAGTHSDFQ